jgi:ketopantoate reductase
VAVTAVGQAFQDLAPEPPHSPPSSRWARNLSCSPIFSRPAANLQPVAARVCEKHLIVLGAVFRASHWTFEVFCPGLLQLRANAVDVRPERDPAGVGGVGRIFEQRDELRARMVTAGLELERMARFVTADRKTHLRQKARVIASLAGSTTLMRATTGEICSTPDGRSFVLSVIEECRRIAELEGDGPRPAFLEGIRAQLTAADSPLTASMYRDMQRNGPIEADHIIGDLLQRGQQHRAAHGVFPFCASFTPT